MNFYGVAIVNGSPAFFGNLTIFGSLTITGDITIVGNVSATRFLGGNGTAAAPTFSFTSDPDTGAYSVAANSLGFAFGGVAGWNMLRSGASTVLQAATGSAYLAIADNTSIQLNGGSGASASVGISSAGAGFITATGANQNITLTPSGSGQIAHTGAGDGTLGLLTLPTGTTKNEAITWGGQVGIYQGSSSRLAFITDSAHVMDLLTSGGNNPSLQNSVGGGSTITLANSGAVTLSPGNVAGFTVDTSLNGTLFGVLFRFTGTTNAFPALKRNSAELQMRLADDSGFSYLQTKLRGSDGTAGANFGPAVVLSLTVVDGVVTAVS